MADRGNFTHPASFPNPFASGGKGAAVPFACFAPRALMQRADFDAEAARMLDTFAETYHRDRDVYTA